MGSLSDAFTHRALIFWPQVITVSEEEIIEAMRLVYMRMKLVIEPSAAVGVVRAPVPLKKLIKRYQSWLSLLVGAAVGVVRVLPIHSQITTTC
jgi:threonine dehydratase